MPPADRDASYLSDMLQAGRAIQDFIAGVDLNRFLGNNMLQAAVERKVEILGEAARLLSEGFKKAHPEVPWKVIVGMRHVLAHEYGEIKQDRMWAVATVHVPRLLPQLERLAVQESGRQAK